MQMNLTGVPEVPRKRGRPATGRALDAAARKRKQREAEQLAGLAHLAVKLPSSLVDRLDRYVADKCGDVTKDDVVQKALEAFFRKR